MKSKSTTLENLIKENMEKILEDKSEMERIEARIEDKHCSKPNKN